MWPIRAPVGLLTLAYAAYLMLEGALQALGLFGPLPHRLVAVFRLWMDLSEPSGWRAGLQILAGFTFAAAGSQLAGSRLSAWALFAMAAGTELAARWVEILFRFPTQEALHALMAADKLLLLCLAGGLAAYVMLGSVEADRPAPFFISTE
jgi:hypothetical protein